MVIDRNSFKLYFMYLRYPLRESQDLLIEHFEKFISSNRKMVVEKVLNLRTKHLTVVLEDIFQSQNSSAVIRTCECMGLQDIHIVEQRTKYQINPRVLKGSHKWIDFHQYQNKNQNNTEACYANLRSNGYKILVTDPSPDGRSIHDIDVKNQKIALVFGNELRGVSPYGIDHADEKICIPMYGFTESLNISVSVAICLNTLVQKLHQGGGSHFLSNEDKNEIKLDWYRKIVRRSDLIEKEFMGTIQ